MAVGIYIGVQGRMQDEGHMQGRLACWPLLAVQRTRLHHPPLTRACRRPAQPRSSGPYRHRGDPSRGSGQAPAATGQAAPQRSRTPRQAAAVREARGSRGSLGGAVESGEGRATPSTDLLVDRCSQKASHAGGQVTPSRLVPAQEAHVGSRVLTCCMPSGSRPALPPPSGGQGPTTRDGSTRAAACKPSMVQGDTPAEPATA